MNNPAWQIDSARHALFLDFDGTLIDIAPEPEAVIISGRLIETLTKLHSAFKGAVSLCSGRSLKNIDRLLHLPFLPAIGLHGLETRLTKSRFFKTLPSPELISITAEVENFVQQEPGLILENKGAAIALHYRCRPDLQDLCINFVNNLILNKSKSLIIQQGKMVLDIRMPGPDKGIALTQFMQNYPFHTRHPIMFGDDLTDESAFSAVSDLNGFGILVSDKNRPSAAKARVKTPADILDVLERALDKI